MVTAEELARLHIDPKWVDPLNATFARFEINDPVRQAAFIGQCAHESGNFRVLQENLNYRAATLMKLWPKRFPTLEIANQYAGKPQKIANMVYANRMGNRDEASGDGFRFCGRGLLQTTGFANYHHAAQALGVDFVMQPELVATPQYAAMTAGFFWATHKLNGMADARNYTGMTRVINGGTIGLDDRVAHINTALNVLTA